MLEALEVEALEVDSYVTACQAHLMTPGATILFPSISNRGKLGPIEMLETVTR